MQKIVYMTRPNILLSESRGGEPTYGGWYCTIQTLPQFQPGSSTRIEEEVTAD